MIEQVNGSTVITGNDIFQFRDKVLLKRLELEAMGMRHSQGSTATLVKKMFGFKGNRASLIIQLKAYIDKTYHSQEELEIHPGIVRSDT